MFKFSAVVFVLKFLWAWEKAVLSGSNFSSFTDNVKFRNINWSKQRACTVYMAPQTKWLHKKEGKSWRIRPFYEEKNTFFLYFIWGEWLKKLRIFNYFAVCQNLQSRIFIRKIASWSTHLQECFCRFYKEFCTNLQPTIKPPPPFLEYFYSRTLRGVP